MKKITVWILALSLALAGAACAEDASLPETLSALDWTFSSGVGAWSTDLRIQADGSFSGSYHDSEMGDDGEAYPDGTVYQCVFSGHLTIGEQTGEKTWKVLVDQLVRDESQPEEFIQDGIRYIRSEPYGLSEGDEMVLYAPGADLSALSEEMQFWAHAWTGDDSADELETWFLTSELNQSGFVGCERLPEDSGTVSPEEAAP